jgi:FkbM family methyltransferase
VATLGASRAESMKLLMLFLVMPLKHRISGLHTRPVTVRIHYSRDREIVLSDASEMLILKELLVEGEYDLSGFDPPHTVLDLGANIGVAALLLRARYPDAQIVAVEPDPATFEKLERNVGGDPGVTTINAAITATPGPISFVSDPMSWASRLAAPGEPSTTVPGVTIDELATRFGVGEGDMIKIDIEGAEHAVIPAASVLDRASVLIGEVHDAGPGTAEHLFRVLEARGWRHDRPMRRRSFSMTRSMPSH